MRFFKWLAVLFTLVLLHAIEYWWQWYDLYENTVLGRPVEYRRLTYGKFWPDFKRSGLWLGDLALMQGREFLVVGCVKGPASISPIQLRCIGGAMEEAFFHESYFKEGVKVLKHYPLPELWRLKRQFELLVAASVASVAAELSFK